MGLSSRRKRRASATCLMLGSTVEMAGTIGVRFDPVKPRCGRSRTTSGAERGAAIAATHGGENPYLASALLRHSDPNVTYASYNRATSLSAAESFRQIVRQYAKR
jgi:hypothetical protein